MKAKLLLVVLGVSLLISGALLASTTAPGGFGQTTTKIRRAIITFDDNENPLTMQVFGEILDTNGKKRGGVGYSYSYSTFNVTREATGALRGTANATQQGRLTLAATTASALLDAATTAGGTADADSAVP